MQNKKFLLVVEWTVMLCDGHMTELKQTKRHDRRTQAITNVFPANHLKYIHAYKTQNSTLHQV